MEERYRSWCVKRGDYHRRGHRRLGRTLTNFLSESHLISMNTSMTSQTFLIPISARFRSRRYHYVHDPPLRCFLLSSCLGLSS